MKEESSLDANKQVVRTFLKHMSAMNGPEIAKWITDDFTVASKGSSVLGGVYGPAEFPALVGRLTETLPNGVELRIIDMFAERDAVLCEAQGTATSAAGKPYNNEYLILFRVRNGRVASMVEYMDTKLIDEVFAPA